MKRASLSPRICAHRGFARVFPENSLSSVGAALSLGAQWVEIDVQMTRDGVPVVYHDTNLRRVSGVRGDIRGLSWAQASKLRVYEPGRLGKRFQGERLASLAQLALFFSKHRGSQLFVELKEESLKRYGRLEMLAAVHAALKPLGTKRAVLISFDEPVLALARQATGYKLGYVLRSRKQLESDFYKRLKPEFVFSDVKRLPRKGSLKLRGVKQCLWEVPDPTVALAAFRLGIDMVETFALDHYLHLR